MHTFSIFVLNSAAVELFFNSPAFIISKYFFSVTANTKSLPVHIHSI
jgi:hypothetical protein